jgi:flagellar protein FliO/FliZ
LGDFMDMVTIILVLAVVFWLTWVVTRFVAKKSGHRSSTRTMRVVERLNLSNDKSLLIVKIGTEYCVVGVTGHEISLIKTLGAEEAEAFDAGAGEDKKAAQWPIGAEGGLWGGVQTFGERLGFAMKRKAKPQSRPYRYSKDEYTQETEQEKPIEQSSGDKSAIDLMNERIRLRKESKWR